MRRHSASTIHVNLHSTNIVLRFSENVASDLGRLYMAVQEMRNAIGMPELPPLQTMPLGDRPIANAQPHLEDDYGPSCDNSPKLTPEDDRLPYAPIHSLYTLTKMRALRSPETAEGSQVQPIDDFISRGKMRLEDAERLFSVYQDQLDGFIYSIGCRYSTLEELRRKSPILSAATLTVAALHDPQSNKVYGICRAELRLLIERSMLQRQVDRDYFRALSIATYWLSDLSWTLSGHAIRRATECNIHNSYTQAIKEQSEDAADYARIWSILYICDQHLAILYDRPAIIQDDWSTQNWEDILQCSFSNAQDERLMSQVELMGILRSIRQLFGPDKGESIPRVYVNQLGHFNRQLDLWIAKWTLRLPAQHPGIGGFPRKGAQLHFHFAQLYLFSHVFRGQSDTLPSYFLDAASKAVTAASTIIDFLLTDPDVSAGIVGMPSYLLSMTAFTCMFLAKVGHKYGDGFIKSDEVLEQINRLVSHFRSLSTGKWHLANLMVGGLERMANILDPSGGSNQPRFANGVNSHLIISEGHETNDPLLAHALPSVDGNPYPTYDTTFGLSPIFGFDPALLDVEGYMASMSHFTNGSF